MLTSIIYKQKEANRMDKTIITAVIIAAASFIMQKTLGNILYGIIIFISRPFKKGDKVSIKWNANEITLV